MESLGMSRPVDGCEVKEIAPRPLSEREAGWIHDILHVIPDWQQADLSCIRVVAEGMEAEGYSIVLKSPKPENPSWKSAHDILGQLWIETENRLTVNVQLSQSEGELRELYVLILDSKARTVRLPTAWKEVSRQAIGG